VHIPRDGGAPRALAPAEGQSDGWLAAPVDCLVDVILGTGANHVPASVGIAAVELLEAAYRSAAAGGMPVGVEGREQQGRGG
jgi:hypothetical protein